MEVQYDTLSQTIFHVNFSAILCLLIDLAC